MNVREKGRNLLGDIFSNKNNIVLFEDLIYNKYKTNYYDTIFQLSGLVQDHSITECYDILKKEKINWNLEMFKENVEEEQIELDFIETPFEAVESIMTCKCGSKKVLTFNKQTRGGDEGTSVFCKCITCGSKWMESG